MLKSKTAEKLQDRNRLAREGKIHEKDGLKILSIETITNTTYDEILENKAKKINNTSVDCTQPRNEISNSKTSTSPLLMCNTTENIQSLSKPWIPVRTNRSLDVMNEKEKRESNTSEKPIGSSGNEIDLIHNIVKLGHISQIMIFPSTEPCL